MFKGLGGVIFQLSFPLQPWNSLNDSDALPFDTLVRVFAMLLVVFINIYRHFHSFFIVCLFIIKNISSTYSLFLFLSSLYLYLAWNNSYCFLVGSRIRLIEIFFSWIVGTFWIFMTFFVILCVVFFITFIVDFFLGFMWLFFCFNLLIELLVSLRHQFKYFSEIIRTIRSLVFKLLCFKTFKHLRPWDSRGNMNQTSKGH